MAGKPREQNMPSHTVINDRYPHGIVERIMDDRLWLKGGDKWYHFHKARMKDQVLPKVGAYVVMTESTPGVVTHIATKHELQPEPDAGSQQLNTALEPTAQPNTAPQQLNTALKQLHSSEQLVDYRIRTDALALAVSLLNLEAHYGIDRDDIYRVAREVIRWIQARGEE